MTERMRHDEYRAPRHQADLVAAQDLARLEQLQHILAEIARGGYRRWGRGFVWMEADALYGTPDAAERVQALYLGEQQHAAQGQAWASKGVRGLVHAYNPQHEALVAVNHPDGLRIYRVDLPGWSV